MSSMIGDNTQNIDFAKEEMDRLARDYVNLPKKIDALVAEFEALPEVIDDEETKGKYVGFIRRTREADKSVEGIREIEKMPHLARERATDNFFFRMRDRLLRRDKKAKLGIGDTALARLTTYDNRILAEEQERRRLAAQEAARIEAARVEAARKLAAEAEEARLLAERARAPAQIEAKQEAAVAAETAASGAKVEAIVAAEAAEAAYVETLSRPADIMRQRSDDGILSTMGTEKFCEITDRKKIDLNVIGAYFAIADIEKAARRYAESVGYSDDASVQIAGVSFGKRAKSVVR